MTQPTVLETHREKSSNEFKRKHKSVHITTGNSYHEIADSNAELVPYEIPLFAHQQSFDIMLCAA